MAGIQVQLADEKTVFFAGSTFSYKDLIKAIPGSSWSKKNKRWELPLESTPDALRIMPSLNIASEVQEAHKQLKARHAKAIAVKDKDINNLPIKGLKNPNGWKLRGYQNAGVAFVDTLASGEGCILGYDMGLGKSLTGLASFQKMINDGVVDYCMVVCPSPLKYATWAKEIALWTGLDYTIIDGDKREKVTWDDGETETLTGKDLRAVQYQQYLFGGRIIVVNYELFLRDTEIMPPVDGRWLVILDECHRLKNPKAQTTKNLVKHLKHAGRKVLASGTPLENNIEELWQLVDFCRPGLLGTFFAFKKRYMIEDFFGRSVSPRPEMMKELQDRIAPIMLRKTKEEALPDLPELTIQEYWVNMLPEQRKLYKEVKEGILENLETGEFSYMEVLAQITRLQQVVDSPALLSEIVGKELPKNSAKLNELVNIVADLPQATKFVVFSQYKQMTDIIVPHLVEEGVLQREQIGYIHGGMKAEVIGELQKGFQTGKIRCMVITTAGNYGLDLSAGSYVIAYDCLFNPQKMNQIYSRCHRSGVKSAVTAINILTNDTYEEKKLKIIQKKLELFKAMVDADDAAFAKMFTRQDLVDML